MSDLSPEQNEEPDAIREALRNLKAATVFDGIDQMSDAERVSRFCRLKELGVLDSMVDALPLLLNLKGKPYKLDDHAPFEELFRFKMARITTFKTGRQVSKTTSQASHSIIRSNSMPNFTTLFVTPLFEQIRRFSTLYVKPFINTSPVKRLWSDTTTVNSVLHQSFKNGSQMIFSFACLDADRIRGVSADEVDIDEIQDLNREHLPIIAETMSYSPWAISKRTGTPKTLDNTLEGSWQESSQAEWFVPCFHCTTNGKPTWNIPTMEFHLEKMIGPWHNGITEENPATICHKCGRPISPRFGRWVHRYEERRWHHAGYHVPQIIMPLHYRDPDKWAVLLAKQQGRGNTSIGTFYNEVLGESYDKAAKLVTMTELKAAAGLGPNTDAQADTASVKYHMRVLAVDWGGGGAKGVSFTTLALLGIKRDGKIDVIWGKRLLTPHDHLGEAGQIRYYYDRFRCHYMAHDYTGAGSLRETFVIQAGVPQRKIMPCMYVRSASAAPCYHVAPTPMHPRDHYRVDKSRSLLLTCACIKTGLIKFFDYDHENAEEPGLIHDFLALIEEKTVTSGAGEIYRISRQEGFSDDFAQAVNIGCIASWYVTKRWPNLAKLAEAAALAHHVARHAPITPAQQAAAGPEVLSDEDWDNKA
jgi:hypothetical protein